jgi:hypothetical protein
MINRNLQQIALPSFLAALPPKVRSGLIDKAAELRHAADPATI